MRIRPCQSPGRRDAIPRVALHLSLVFAAAFPATVRQAPAQSGFAFRQAPGKIEILLENKPFSNFYYGPEWTWPFLHPLRTATGLAITRGFPVEKVEGESQDHKGHRGLWFGNADIEGVDFWRDKGPDVTGRMVSKSPPKIGRETLAGSFRLVTPQEKILGSIELVFRFRRSGANPSVDTRITLRADRGRPLKMGDGGEGTFGLRLDDAFREDRGAVLTNSDGLVGSAKIWGKRAKWVDYSTSVKGQAVGVTVFDHPGNPKYPTYWHARDYGLCATNPFFSERGLPKDQTRDGSITIPAGGALVFRYRVVIHPGGVDSIDVQRISADFAGENL